MGGAQPKFILVFLQINLHICAEVTSFLWHLITFATFQYIKIGISTISFLNAGDVWFSFNGKTYQNNSLVTLEDTDEKSAFLLCITNFSACCTHNGSAVGNWYFPNGSRVPSTGAQWNFYRSRGDMVVRLHRKRGGVDGIYHCVIPDSTNIYIGVYNSSTGEIWNNCRVLSLGFMF